MNDKTILVVDDEVDLLEMVQSIFDRAGFTNILTAASGKEAIKVWKDRQPDLIILDIMMPGMDGLSVLKEIRATSNIPVLLLTARGEAEDRVTGFESGADDYLIKPFHPKELLLRVQVILNRAYPQKERKIYLEAAVIDLEKAEVQRGENQFPLTGKELTLLEKLAENAGRIVTTGALCGAVCGEFWQGYESTLSTHIRHLREKIEENPSKPVSLVTIKGVGYRLNIKGGEMMNTVERFFRRYIFSTIGIIALFFVVNLLLVGMFFTIAYLNGVADSNFPIEDFSNHIIVEDGKLTADTQALDILHHADAWAMILNDDGTVIWEDGLPEKLPREYTATDIAIFSRWYLDDYPVNIWKRPDGLLVIGFIPGSVFNHYISTNTAYIWPFFMQRRFR